MSDRGVWSGSKNHGNPPVSRGSRAVTLFVLAVCMGVVAAWWVAVCGAGVLLTALAVQGRVTAWALVLAIPTVLLSLVSAALVAITTHAVVKASELFSTCKQTERN